MPGSKRSLTGIRPSGNVHLGNYVGSIRPALARQTDYECLYFLADMHSLTTLKDPKLLRQYTYDLVAAWLAFGFDPSRHMIYRQSDIPLVTELAWYLSCVTGMGFLEKAHAYKDALSQSREVNHGVFAYPVLMAADILLYDADIVPVGKDQKQHVEMSRDMAGSLNAVFGEGCLKLPEVKIDEQVMAIPGLDGRKMSKSYNNEIPVFAGEDELKKLIMSIKTDSTPLESPKELKGSLIGELLPLFATEQQVSDLSARLAKGGMGWGHAKQELFEVINTYLSEPRRRYGELRKDERKLEAVLNEGATRAYEIARRVIDRVRTTIGFGTYGYTRST
ncbi:MAG: tryptophan--tRNA ligase [Proteobacteria bacterium]|nr:MAG: tryptophan--tRNA ligase [Pseudomonadota bacterium]